MPVFTRNNSKNLSLVDLCPLKIQREGLKEFLTRTVKGKKVAFEIGITYHAHCPMLYRAAATYQALMLGENQAHSLISGMAETLSGHLLKGKRH